MSSTELVEATVVVSNTDTVVEVIEVAVIPVLVLVPTVGLVLLLIVTIKIEEIMRSC